jgi:hypothetical protein
MPRSRDPTGFIRGIDRAVIDEIQRAPDLMLAIKESVDRDEEPGRFLLTGSANLATVPAIADSLAGRMAVVSLLPFAQSEIRHDARALKIRLGRGTRSSTHAKPENVRATECSFTCTMRDTAGIVFLARLEASGR